MHKESLLPSPSTSSKPPPVPAHTLYIGSTSALGSTSAPHPLHIGSTSAQAVFAAVALATSSEPAVYSQPPPFPASAIPSHWVFWLRWGACLCAAHGCRPSGFGCVLFSVPGSLSSSWLAMPRPVFLTSSSNLLSDFGRVGWLRWFAVSVGYIGWLWWFAVLIWPCLCRIFDGLQQSQGIGFAELYSAAREEFIVSNEHTLRGHLAELSDHRLVRSKRTSSSAQLLSVPLSRETIKGLLTQLSMLPAELA